MTTPDGSPASNSNENDSLSQSANEVAQEVHPRVSAYAVKLPQFWPTAPEAYFEQVEATFRTSRITVSRTQYDYLLQAIPASIATDVLDVMRKCKNSATPYEDMKSELIRRNSLSESARLEQVLSSAQMGDRSPSAFYRHISNIAGSTSAVNDNLIRTLWMRRLPQNLEISLKPFDTTEIETVLKIADEVYEVSKRSPSIAAVEKSTPPSSSTQTEIAELREMFSKLSSQISSGNRSRSRSQNRNPRTFEKSEQASSKPSGIQLCKYHDKFGNAAKRCEGKPCPMAVTMPPTQKQEN